MPGLQSSPVVTLLHCHTCRWTIKEDQYFDSESFRIKRINRLQLWFNSRLCLPPKYSKSLDLTFHFGEGVAMISVFHFAYHPRLLLCVRACAGMCGGQRVISNIFLNNSPPIWGEGSLPEPGSRLGWTVSSSGLPVLHFPALTPNLGSRAHSAFRCMLGS